LNGTILINEFFNIRLNRFKIFMKVFNVLYKIFRVFCFLDCGMLVKIRHAISHQWQSASHEL